MNPPRHARCSGQAPGAEAPFDLARLDLVASSLAWSKEKAEKFRKSFETAWGEDDANFLKPQADVVIESLSVAPDHRGKGFGTTLIEAAFDRGRHLDAQSIGIMVIHDNDAVQALYEKYFEPFITFHGAYFDHQIKGVTKYRKQLHE
ncbi:N-acetyltransferase [uncultured Tateyamaria sp.]|uniref:GNAT family N-acetyltransferase n=1 Tax=uncultured Tateyamaria sp. TaxID=455651 RepID=UPI002618EE72|nr:GNAT family N-acetyltransferase [uncultured Tateyamaria sp.]